MNLADLERGKSAVVRKVPGTDGDMIRLMEMGLLPGTQVTLRGVAPLGDPLQFDLRGYKLSVRKAEASRIEVEPHCP